MNHKKMRSPKKDLPTDLGRAIRGGSPAMLIPTLLVVGPLLGFFAGAWIGEKFADNKVLGGLIGLFLGFGASIREVIKVIQRISAEEEQRQSKNSPQENHNDND